MGSAFPVRTVILICALCLGCRQPPAREYQLQGQVVAVDPARQEITIKHEDIPQFMPGMTMAFKVADPRLLDGRVAGDLVKATLVVGDASAHLRTLERTGSAPLTAPSAPTTAMNVIEPGAAVRDAELVDQAGTARRITDWRGKTLAVTFIYTRCPVPTFCPLMDRRFKSVQTDVQRDPALAGRVALLSVTIDPAYDTPAVLARHAAALGADPAMWHFLTGKPEALEDFASQFGVSVVRDDPEDLAHNLRTVIVDREGRLTKVFTGNAWSPADFMAELRMTGGARAAR